MVIQKTMSKLFILIMAGLVACAPPRSGNTAGPTGYRLVLDSTSQCYNRVYRVFTLDSCEYIVVGYGDMQWGSHKGDCRNPIHRQKR